MTNTPNNQVSALDYLEENEEQKSSLDDSTKEYSGEKKPIQNKSCELDVVEIKNKIRCDFNVRETSKNNLADCSTIGFQEIQLPVMTLDK
jgi:hypothetical protein